MAWARMNENLPAFVVMHETKPRGDDNIWTPGFLPKSYQPLTLDARRREEIANLNRAAGMSDAQQRSQLDLLREMNQEHQQRSPQQADLAARIQSFELAYRMQTAAPEALDLRQESAAIQNLYGLNRPETAHVRPAVPVGPAAGRARRALRADFLQLEPHLRRGGQ